MHVLEGYGVNEKQVLAATGLSKSFLDEHFYTYDARKNKTFLF